VLKLANGAWVDAGTDQNGYVYALAVDSANALWAGQNGMVSKLGVGATAWAEVGTGLPDGESATSLAFDAAGKAYVSFFGGGVFSLAPGGTTWTATNAGLADMDIRVLQRDAAGNVYAGSNEGVYKLAGTTWQLQGTGLTEPVYALAFDAGGNLFAGVDNGYVWQLAAGGTAWSQIRLGLGSRTVQAFATGGGHIYAGTDASHGSPSGVYVYVPLPSVVEFYNIILDNYFITAEPNEQAAVLSGAAGPGWSATGNFFNAGGAQLVCRFYGSISPGPNSHFYTIIPSECQLLKDIQASTPATQKRWNFESNDFASTAPVNGGCAAGMVPVYRAYNNGFTRGIDSNHRITSNRADYLAQIAKGWVGEDVVMCAPPF